MTLRVALDVTPELIAATGVARYTRELRLALEQRDDVRVAAFAVGRRSEPVPLGVRHLPVPLRIVHRSWDLTGRPRGEWLAGGSDLVHSLDLVAPPTRRPLVVTIHDVVTSELPGLHSERNNRLQGRRLAELDQAAVVLAVSASTADALRALDVAADRIHVVPHGLSRLVPDANAPVPPARFMLAVGTLEPRKAHDTLLRAFAAGAPADVRLVCAGPDGGAAPALRRLAGELGLAERVSWLGRVSDGALAALYRDATLFCMPSLSEGFGLPVLEAMGAGLPVLASDLPCLREFADGCAEFVPPGDLPALARAIGRLLADPDARGEMAAAGRARAAGYTWSASAEATVAAYRAALAGA
jgi:glycosyltransferase involved in cell wall biosynthesis